MDRRESNRRWYDTFDAKTMTAVFGEDNVMKVEYIVCGTCEGKGSHVNPSIDSNGLTREDFDAEPGFFEDYMDGMYDIPCNECGGMRVVPWPVSQLDVELVEQWLMDEAAYQAECDAERRFGC